MDKANQNIAISVIIPVYNAELYLSTCIEHILFQTFTNFEIIIVDDGSTDKSGGICDEYASKDARIKVFHQKNKGVSAARNFALSKVCGEYVMFVDADDYWLDNECLAILLSEAIKNNVDIVRGEYRAVDKDGNLSFERSINEKKGRHSYEIVSSDIFLSDVFQGEFFLFLSLFRYEKVKHLRFDIQQIFLEDMDFYAKFFLQPVSCEFVPLRFYAYRKITSSASAVASIKKLENSFDMCNKFDKYASDAVDAQLKQYFRYRSVMMYYWTLGTVASDDSYFVNRQKIIKILDLKALQKSTFKRMWKYFVLNNSFLIISMLPLHGVFWLRIKNRIAIKIYSLINKFKKTVR